ncbi:ArsR/SmtB family transcription factor [Amorphoplanes digitatis]|uniref:DNA-binding transcriptional ArsR family regulator n=1 Tax=Actinoplanes digitatis TaxID=1868 RepID=A0A7W7HWD5_9ACTN|nr:helix-turn-helix domain-containing protein [Actinoplanes digitatis]MBB4761969.1 DNA-binding transcriptional ArsR family regulator [Actinoplanes digitatis]BFE70679.1 winged helix-turn-helix domain-containing protein [Actinoplanes digitatis]GID91082.1 transcriptional regulator [Actinoplanes digitatis]
MLIQVSPADVAACRYAISPLFEAEGAVRTLTGHSQAGVLGPWIRRMRPRLAGLRRAEPAVGALISLFRTEDNADFLHPPPTGPRRSFADELAGVRATPLDRARAELELNLRGHRAPPAYARRILDGDDVVDRLADALQAAWSTLVEPEWPRLLAVLERDVVQRAGRVAAYGWAEGLAGLHPLVSWTANGDISIRHRDTGRYRLTGGGLLFVSSIFTNLAISTDPDRPFTVAYRARGVADIMGPPSAGPHDDALGPLIGPGRAAILRALAGPATTSQLAAQLGMSLGGVGGHLAVLHRAGLVARTRTGRSVLYARTERGETLAS